MTANVSEGLAPLPFGLTSRLRGEKGDLGDERHFRGDLGDIGTITLPVG